MFFNNKKRSKILKTVTNVKRDKNEKRFYIYALKFKRVAALPCELFDNLFE